MRTTEIHAFKKIASKNFKLKDVTFIGFTDIGKADISHSVSVDRHSKGTTAATFDYEMFEIVADLKIKYEGNPPESYRVLNSMLMDWVDDNEKSLKNQINPEIKAFLQRDYPEIDTTDLDEDFDDYIWEDQVDYHPSIDEKESEIHFAIELVLSIEEE